MSREASTKSQLKSVQKTLSILNESKGKELIKYRLKLRDHIRKLIQKIIVFPDGMKNIVLSYEIITPEYTTIEDINRPHIDAINAFLDSADNEQDISRATSSIMVSEAEIDEYSTNNTGKGKRCFNVFFETGAFKEIVYDPTLGYYVASELTEKNWRIGDTFQMMGDFTNERFKKSKFNTIDYDQWQKDFAQRAIAALEKTNQPAPEIKYEKILYHPNPPDRHAAEVTKRIIELRDRKGLKWSEIKTELERNNIKTFSGMDTWNIGTLHPIYSRAVSS
jgi:hypothetical protein